MCSPGGKGSITSFVGSKLSKYVVSYCTFIRLWGILQVVDVHVIERYRSELPVLWRMEVYRRNPIIALVVCYLCVSASRVQKLRTVDRQVEVASPHDAVSMPRSLSRAHNRVHPALRGELARFIVEVQDCKSSSGIIKELFVDWLIISC